MQLHSFTFGPFQENTFVLYDESNECVIVDPGCYSSEEKNALKEFVSQNGLKPVMLLNTHCHVDHVAGNAFVFDTWGLKPIVHKDDMPVLDSQQRVSDMYGLPCELSPRPEKFMNEGDVLSFGTTSLEVIHTPGHAPGHVVFLHKASNTLINGDVLFNGSIGRTDLPLGNHEQLLESIRTKIYTLPDETIVYCGHGPSTTVGKEKLHNPFVRA
ncbi:MAG: metallo-beta-lactamase [Bacteroidetes bacterium]|jgi:glyoxylase-like metal-dependent hydrolase (beta-lactamase superfamily II)|nr:metallo-beta-lactamase [Bacteroidota bacterium]